MGAKVGHNAQVYIELGSTSSSDTSASNGVYPLINVTNASVDLPNNSVDISELGDAAMRRLDGRADFSLDVDCNLDFTETDAGSQAQHEELVKDIKDGTVSRLFVVQDSTVGQGSRVGIYADCIVNGNLDLPGDSENSVSFTFDNADGETWTFKASL